MTLRTVTLESLNDKHFVGVKKPNDELELQLQLSKQPGNILKTVDDGLLVLNQGSEGGSIEISPDNDNQIIQKPNGLYVPRIAVSPDENNRIIDRADGLYIEGEYLTGFGRPDKDKEFKTAREGTIYRDLERTDGAILWIKRTDANEYTDYRMNESTGIMERIKRSPWQVLQGDTGWVELKRDSYMKKYLTTNSRIYVRRVNASVYMMFAGDSGQVFTFQKKTEEEFQKLFDNRNNIYSIHFCRSFNGFIPNGHYSSPVMTSWTYILGYVHIIGPGRSVSCDINIDIHDLEKAKILKSENLQVTISPGVYETIDDWPELSRYHPVYPKVEHPA